MFYEASTDVLGEVENVLGELYGEDFQTSLSNLWTAIQDLSKDPSSSVTQGLLVQRSAEFINRANAVYQDLTNYQDNLNKQIKEKVTTINQYGKQIQALNDQIRKIECGGIEHANDLRDTRNQILDELGKLCKMTYSEDSLGNVSVRIEDSDFVRGDLFYEIGLDASDATGFYTPFWIKDAEYTVLADGTKKYNIKGAEVFNLDQTVSSSLDTDIGGLKALLLARGDHRANYTDIGNNYDNISQSIVMNVQAEFDQMIHNVTTKINSILAEVYDPSRGYMCDKDGSPLQLFQKITTDGYEKVTDAGGNVTWKYAEEDPTRTDTLYTLGNLQVNANLLREPTMLGFKKADGSADYDTTGKLKAAFTEESYTLNPNVLKKTTILDYYKDLVSQVSNTGYAFRNIYENQQTTVEATYNAREQIIGVSSEEELSNMIRFQNAYNASSRYINVISELLEHIISTLAV